MTFKNYTLAMLLLSAYLSGCESVGDTLTLKRQPLTIQQQAALAVDKNYQIALRTISANGVSSSETPANSSFGPRIGQYYLADEYVVYRHANPQAIAQAGTPVDAVTGKPIVPAAPTQQTTRVNFTYFLVSPKGIVDDYATGSLDIAQTSCLQIVSGQTIICEEPDRLSQDFELFDNALITSKGSTLDTWNVSANAVEPQPITPLETAPLPQ